MGRRRRRYPPRRPRYDGPPVNDAIRARELMVVSSDGDRLGTFPTGDALKLARDRGMDLVVVAPNARPPVARIADWGKMKYQRQKREQAARRRAHSTQMKELKVRPKTDDHDMKVKTKRTRKFLKNGDKVKITVWFRGRERAHQEIGAEQCLRIADAVKEHGHIEQMPHMDGRNMYMILAPGGSTDRKS